MATGLQRTCAEGYDMDRTLSQRETLSRETHRSETEMMALVLQKGVEYLWRERILSATPARSLK